MQVARDLGHPSSPWVVDRFYICQGLHKWPPTACSDLKTSTRFGAKLGWSGLGRIRVNIPSGKPAKLNIASVTYSRK